MYRILLLLLCFGFQLLYAQKLEQILVLNEGYYNFTTSKIEKPVSLGSYELSTKTYKTIFEIAGARFASDLKIDGNFLWIAADQYLYKYDLKSFSLLASVNIVGVRRLEIFENLLIISRGEYQQTLDSYIQIYDKESLKLLKAIPASDLPYTCESIQIINSNAYVGVNNGFVFGKEVGEIAVIDLKTLELTERIDLGKDGKNPENLMVIDQLIYSLNNKNYTGSSISKIDLSNGNTVTTFNLNEISSLCGTSTLVPESILYQESGKSIIGKFDLQSQQSASYKDLGKSFYGMSFEDTNKWIIAAETDFVSFGKVFVYDLQWNELFQFKSEVSPGNFAFIYNTSVATDNEASQDLIVFPNPVIDYINFNTNMSEIDLMDVSGRSILKAFNTDRLSCGEILDGLYLLSYKYGKNNAVIKLRIQK